MKNIIFLLFILSVACSCKNKTKNEVSPVQSDTKTETSINEDIVEEIFLTAPYPAEIHGIWGNTTFHKDLLKYNAVSKTLEFIKFDTDLKIGKDQILAMRPQYSEPHEFNSTKYALIAAGKDSLFVKNRSTGEKQLYVKLLDLPNEDLYSLYDDEYSAINLMEWNWFKGRYKYISAKDSSNFSNVEFTADGRVSEWIYYSYSFGIDSDGQDYIWLAKDTDISNYFLIEYKPNNTYYCYHVKDFEDWDESFVKEKLAFKLEKLD